MKSFLKKILGLKEKETTSSIEENAPIETTINNIDLPLDVKFAESFTGAGGKFIYCVDEQDVLNSIKNIVLENEWTDVLSFDESLNKILDKTGTPHSNKAKGNCAFFTTCEALIAKDGAVLISSNQTKGRNLTDLPYDFIIMGKVSDILEDRSEGLRVINMKWHGNIPSGITTIKGPNTVTGTNNILDNGSLNTSKNIYLLLVE